MIGNTAPSASAGTTRNKKLITEITGNNRKEMKKIKIIWIAFSWVMSVCVKVLSRL